MNNEIDEEYKEMQSGVDDAKKKHADKILENVSAANKRMFLRECQEAGIDPKRGVSPSLLKILGRGND